MSVKNPQVELWLADTSVRAYRKKDGTSSLRLRSFLMVKTNCGFSLTGYLREISCRIFLADGKTVELRCSVAVASRYDGSTMVNDFWAVGTTDSYNYQVTSARLQLDYHLSFTGHPTELPARIELPVPVINRRVGEYSGGRQFAGCRQPKQVHWALRDRTP